MRIELDQITDAIVDTSVQIHRDLGPGLFESVYESILAPELARRGLDVPRQGSISFSYDGIEIVEAFRTDLIVEGRVLVEVKSVERSASVHAKQILTYLRLTGLRVGLLLNFGEENMKKGLKRVVNDFTPGPSSRLRVNQRN